MAKQLTPKEIAKNLMSDVPAYQEFIERMLRKHLNSNETDRVYWDAWFRGAEGRDLEDADAGKTYKELVKEELVEYKEPSPKPKVGIISYHVQGTRFDTEVEAIAVLKNDPEFDFETAKEFFGIFFQKWDDEYKNLIPHWTDKYLKKLLKSTPAITEKEAKEKYQGEQLEKVLSYINKKHGNIHS